MKSIKVMIIIILIFMSISFTVIKWFNGWYYIYQTDSLFFINSTKRIYDSLYFWKDSHSLGYASPGFNLIPFYYIQSMIYEVLTGLFKDWWKATVISEAVMYYITLLLSLCFSFSFFKELYSIIFKRCNDNKVGGIECLGFMALAIFYTLNIHTATYVFWRFFTWALFWPSLPLVSYLYLKYVTTTQKRKMLIFILLTALVFVTPLGAGFSQAGFILLLLSLLILSLLLGIVLGNVIQVMKKFTIFILTVALLLSWIIIPQFLYAHTTYHFAASTLIPSTKQLEYASRFTTIMNIMRFMGYYVFYSTYGNLSYPYVWAKMFKQRFQVLTFMYPALLGIALLALNIEKRHRRIRLAFLLIALLEIVLIIIMKGSAKPFPEIGYMLLKINSVFFRHPYDRFIHLYFFYYCILILVFVRFLVNKMRYYNKIASLVVSTILTMVLIVNLTASYPLLTGEVIHPLDKMYLENSDYLRLARVIAMLCNNTNYCRVLITPFSVYGEYSYNISGRISHVILKPLAYNFVSLNVKIIQFGYSPVEKQFFLYLNNLTKTSRYRDFINVMKLFGVQYIILQKDYTPLYVTNPLFIGGNNKFISMLKRISLIEKVWEGNDFTIYRVRGVLNHIIYSISKGIRYELFESMFDNKNTSILITAYDLAKRIDDSYLINDLESLLGVALILKPFMHIDYTINIPRNGLYEIIILGKGRINITIDGRFNYIVNIPDNNGKTIHIYLRKGRHSLSLSVSPVVSFEFHKDFDLRILDLLNKEFYVFLNNDSLCLTTHVSNQWSYLRLPSVQLAPGLYEIIIKMKYNNVDRTHIVLRVFNLTTNKWQYYETIVPGQSGTSGWHVYKKRILVLSKSSTMMSISINAGGVKNRVTGNATTCIDYIRVYYADNRIRAIIIKPSISSYKYLNSSTTIIGMEYINPTLWRVYTSNTKPFMLIFAEAYDPLWEAGVYKDGRLVEVVRSIPVYGVINGFWIDKTGNLTIVIRYVPQDWFELGLKISATTFALCVFYLVWDWRRCRGDRWALWLERRVRSIPRYLKGVVMRSLS